MTGITLKVLAAQQIDLALAPEVTPLTFEIELGQNVQLWDEFSPALYQLELALKASIDGKDYTDSRQVPFGLREVRAERTQITINGRKTFLRGTLECGIFPLTGYPPTDIDSWKHIIQVCQDHGLNHIRFHSWCPPEAAFQAADEMGFYYQVECASWANQGASIGEGDPLDEWLYQEGDRIIAAYGNHPSFLLMAYGNEPAGEIRRLPGEMGQSLERKRSPSFAYQRGRLAIDPAEPVSKHARCRASRPGELV